MAQTSAINLSVRASSGVFLIENLLRQDQQQRKHSLQQAVALLRHELARPPPTQPPARAARAAQASRPSQAPQACRPSQAEPPAPKPLKPAEARQPAASDARKPATRRSRTLFADWQLKSLEFRFARNKYLTTADRVKVARVLGLEQLQVKTWFQVSRGAAPLRSAI